MGSRSKLDSTPPPPKPRADVVSATEAQNNFGQVLAQAMREGTVVITRHHKPAAAILSIDRYEELTARDAPALDELTREFDALLGRMQTDEAAAAVDTLFGMEPEDLGRAAVRGARRDSD